MLTAQQVSDRCSDNERPAVEEIAEHFRDTIFWNWAESVADGLDDESHEGRSDETAREIDAHFIASLPVYVPALFRAIQEFQAEAASLRNECATANLERIRLQRIVHSTVRNLDHMTHRPHLAGDDPPTLSGKLWGKVAHVCGLGSTSARELCREVGSDPDHETA